MAKNWKRAHDNLLETSDNLRAEIRRQDSEIAAANAQLREIGKQLADAGSERASAVRRVSLASYILRGAAERIRADGHPHAADALYAQADAL